MEKKASLLEVDDKNAQRKLIAMDAENCKLKEETSKLITQVGFFLVIYDIPHVAVCIDIPDKTSTICKCLIETFGRFQSPVNVWQRTQNVQTRFKVSVFTIIFGHSTLWGPFVKKSHLQVTELKSSNLKLSKNLEEAMDRYEILTSQRTDLENRMETDQVIQINFIGLAKICS